MARLRFPLTLPEKAAEFLPRRKLSVSATKARESNGTEAKGARDAEGADVEDGWHDIGHNGATDPTCWSR